jgi:lysophospholipase L1-like esterase
VITDPDVVRILCFGDSNTHGACAEGADSGRLPADQRWTGVLQRLLGGRFDVVEEGLNGRTTDVEYEDRPGCNGRPYLLPCLLSHQPLDIVVVMLGTNDLKACFGRTPEAIAAALRGYLDDIAVNAVDRRGQSTAVVLVSPIWIDDSAALWREVTAANYDSTGVAGLRELGSAIRRLAQERGVAYADAASVAHAGDDGLHLTPDSHERLAELVAATVTRVLPLDSAQPG